MTYLHCIFELLPNIVSKCLQAHREAVRDYKRQLCQIAAQKLAAEKEAQKVKTGAETQ